MALCVGEGFSEEQLNAMREHVRRGEEALGALSELNAQGALDGGEDLSQLLQQIGALFGVISAADKVSSKERIVLDKIEKRERHIERLEYNAAHCGSGKAGRNKRNHLKDQIDQHREQVSALWKQREDLENENRFPDFIKNEFRHLHR